MSPFPISSSAFCNNVPKTVKNEKTNIRSIWTYLTIKMNSKLSSVTREKPETRIHTSMRSSTSSWEIFSLVCARSSVLLQLRRGQHYHQRVCSFACTKWTVRKWRGTTVGRGKWRQQCLFSRLWIAVHSFFFRSFLYPFVHVF